MFQTLAKRRLAFILGVSFCAVLTLFLYLPRNPSGTNEVHPVTVSGRVTLNGRPIEGWEIVFAYAGFDMQGSTAKAVTDSDGRFVMASHFPGNGGLYPGQYKVGVIPPKKPKSMFSTGSGQFKFPTAFADPNSSGLEAEVRGDADNEFNFSLYPRAK